MEAWRGSLGSIFYLYLHFLNLPSTLIVSPFDYFCASNSLIPPKKNPLVNKLWINSSQIGANERAGITPAAWFVRTNPTEFVAWQVSFFFLFFFPQKPFCENLVKKGGGFVSITVSIKGKWHCIDLIMHQHHRVSRTMCSRQFIQGEISGSQFALLYSNIVKIEKVPVFICTMDQCCYLFGWFVGAKLVPQYANS